MEFPEELVEGNKRPNNFIPTSKRKGFLRFHTKEIEQIVEKFIPLDFEFQREITPFVIEYFKKFYERNNYWRQIISFLSEIDCSLAKLA
jgi:DNA mismatch repair ATPase MutS